MKPEREYYASGQIKRERWINRAGKQYKLDGPAVRGWHVNGRLEYEGWYINNQLHRLDGPAFQWWYDNGQPRQEKWCINDQTHRLDGPAEREWGEDGQLVVEDWFINDVQYETEAEFQVAVDLYKANEIAGLF